MRFDEWREKAGQSLYLSATPADYELEISGGVVVEQIIRPTGLMDPKVEVRRASGQVDDLLGALRECVKRGERVLVTTLTKRMAEELTDYYAELGIRIRYLHSDIKTIERMEIIRELREGEFDVLVGINLLREGLDIPEVALVAILDADKEGFLRSARSLIQTIGRAARNVNGRVILYADQETDSIRRTLEETARRRVAQGEYNELHGITPRTITKQITSLQDSIWESDYVTVPKRGERGSPSAPAHELPRLIDALRGEMKAASGALEFERAADLRDRIRALEQELIQLG
jgi:excinuclease ABC subunit B